MKFHKICFFTIIPNFYKISSPRHGPCKRHYNTCKFQASCGPRRAEIAKFMEICEFSRNSAFFGENDQKSGIFMEFHENGIKCGIFDFRASETPIWTCYSLSQSSLRARGAKSTPNHQNPPHFTKMPRKLVSLNPMPR